MSLLKANYVTGALETLTVALFSVTFIENLDLTIKVISFVLGVFVSAYTFKKLHHDIKNRKLEIELNKKNIEEQDLKLHKLLEESKSLKRRKYKRPLK